MKRKKLSVNEDVRKVTVASFISSVFSCNTGRTINKSACPAKLSKKPNTLSFLHYAGQADLMRECDECGNAVVKMG
jgi:hypothetical protein